MDAEKRRQLSEQKKLAQSKLPGRLDNEESNPCYKEHHLSAKCLSENPKDGKVCEVYFENYKACKQFWLSVQLKRRKEKIDPELPPLAERQKIKAEYLAAANGNN